MHIYDYIIVGAGSAGCVLANRLSTDPHKTVLLIEAGGHDGHPYVGMPMGVAKVLCNDRLTRTYTAIATADGQVEPWQRGRLIGGTSSINGMVYTRGQPEDFGDWEEAGATGWGWDAMQRAYRAIEDQGFGAAGGPGRGGPLHVSSAPYSSPLSERIVAAAEEMGVPRREDLNGPDQHGVGYFSRTIKGGRRWSAARAFLQPAQGRRNLTVRTGLTVERITFTDRKATGVAVVDARGSHSQIQGHTIILSAGTVESPKLLQLSGIGPADLLHAHGVPIVADRRDVGQNLREHRMFTLQYALDDASLWRARQYQGGRLVFNVMRYLLARTGVMSTLAYDIAAFVKTRPDLARPDAELVFAPYSFDMSSSTAIAGKVRFEATPGMQIVCCPLRPTSQGSITLTSSDPVAPPCIIPNYLATAQDVATSIATMRYTRALMRHATLRSAIGVETVPGTQSIASDAEIERFVRRSGHCGLHAVGTCRMGSDAASVVDPHLRVRGVDGLRVVDCSVMPTMISGHTNAPAMALAWRAADLLLGEG